MRAGDDGCGAVVGLGEGMSWVDGGDEDMMGWGGEWKERRLLGICTQKRLI